MTSQNRSSGYSVEEYFAISSRDGLPKRCPLLRKCCKAVWTRYVLGFDVVGSKVSFQDFLSSESQYYDQDSMIGIIEQLRWSEPDKQGGPVFFYAENICPEITLFEERYLPHVIAPSGACGEIHYYFESKQAAVRPKHYSECAEFSEYMFQNIREIKLKNNQPKTRKRSHISRTMKFEIFQRDGFRCHYCKRHKSQFPEGIHLTLDHKKPYVDGGDDSFENLVTACSECNNGKSNKIIKE